MFDFCTKKKMALAIFLLFSISVVTLVVESAWPTRHKIQEVKFPSHIVPLNKTCPPQKTKAVSDCERCSKDELRKIQPECQETGFKQKILCDNKETFYHNCEITPYMDERNFWIFQAVTFTLFAVSYSLVRVRQKKLDGQLMDKINRQIASGI
ncbi:protein JTB-like [Crassostrea virginica]|uniref:Protein JTB-like n=1 Tax=Crassostrea virginica TaxID=6565 RepID=A0A8B8E2C1_CRAVI|nr:protein JTB-like [Crassostrea virginica]